jgi:tRNA/rRNA methyltransferase
MNLTNKVTVVLHRPIYQRNVGMCARAMANMGLERLVIIHPDWQLLEEGKQGAAHAQKILREAIVYRDHQEFLASEGDGIRLALSGRDGRLKRPSELGETLAAFAAEPEHPVHAPDTVISLHFGPEDDGLSNEEMELCHHVCRLPTYSEIASLNLSHAVLLTTYMLRSALASAPVTKAASYHGEARVKRGPAYYPTETIRHWLEALGFDLSARRVTIEKTLNRVLLSRCPTQDELRIVDSVLQQTVRLLRSRQTAPATPDASRDLRTNPN